LAISLHPQIHHVGQRRVGVGRLVAEAVRPERHRGVVVVAERTPGPVIFEIPDVRGVGVLALDDIDARAPRVHPMVVLPRWLALPDRGWLAVVLGPELVVHSLAGQVVFVRLGWHHGLAADNAPVPMDVIRPTRVARRAGGAHWR